jgi:hypothetical protein
MAADTKTYSQDELDSLLFAQLSADINTYSPDQLNDQLLALFDSGACVDPLDISPAANYPINDRLTLVQNELQNSWDGSPLFFQPGVAPPFVESQHEPAEIPLQSAKCPTGYFIDTNGQLFHVRSPQDDTQVRCLDIIFDVNVANTETLIDMQASTTGRSQLHCIGFFIGDYTLPFFVSNVVLLPSAHD